MKLPARFTVTRPQGGPDGDSVKILIQDAVSGCKVCEVRIDPRAMMDAITGSASQKCEVVWRPSGLGKKPEVKGEFVPRVTPLPGEERPEQAARATAPFEVDDWKPIVGGYGNMHRFVRKDGVEGYNVSFRRLVELTPDALEAEANKIREEWKNDGY